MSQKQLLEEFRKTEDLEIVYCLFQPYISLVYGLCLKYLESREASEDAVQDIYILICGKLHSSKIEHFRPWLYTVSKNHCLQLLRKKSTQRPKQADAVRMYSDQVLHPDDISKEQELANMELCIQKLNEKQREVINLFYFEKMSYEDITTKLKWEWGKVRSHLNNGRRNIKKCMESNQNEK